MGKIKDKALGNEKKYTLKPEEVQTLIQYRQVAQQQLDQMLQRLTSVYLHSVAVGRFGYEAGSDLGFKLDLEQEQDNITITKL